MADYELSMAFSRDSEDPMKRIRSFAAVGLLAAMVSMTAATTVHAAEPANSGIEETISSQSDQVTRFIVKRDSAVSDARFARSVRAAGLTLVKAQPALR